MALEALIDPIKEKAIETWNRVQESSTYNTLRERYETLTPAAQKGIIAGVAVLISLFLLSFPYSYLSNSSDQVEEFEHNRSLLRHLLRASRLATEAAGGTPTISPEQLKSNVEGRIPAFNLQPEQIAGVIDIENGREAAGRLAPPTVDVKAVGLSLKQLNLKQVVDVGFELQRLNPSVKLAGLEMTATASDPHYFDVLYKLVAFSMPQPKEPETASGPPSRRERPPSGEESESEEE